MKPLTRLLFIASKPILRSILSLFFKREHLIGRHFEINSNGYRWALHSLWTRNILRLAPPVPWPAAPGCRIANPSRLIFHPDDLNNFQSPGVYFQNYNADIFIGRGSYIAQNVGIITQNHDPVDLDKHLDAKDVILGDRCWVGMNSVLMPGVILGNGTIVGAGSIVTRSFQEGNILIAGIPARKIREL